MTDIGITVRSAVVLRSVVCVGLCATLAGCGTFAPTAESPLQGAATIQHVSLARLQERQGDTIGARRIYEQVLAEDPSEATAHHRLGVLDARAGDFANAIRHFESARQAAPASSELLNDLGYACYLSGDMQAAERWLRESVRADNANSAAHNNLGLVLGATGRDRECLAAFRMAGSMAEAYNNMAWTLSQRGDIEGARRNYLMALDADPTLKNAAEALVALANHEETMTRIAERTANGRQPTQATPRAQVVAQQRPATPPARARRPVQMNRPAVNDYQPQLAVQTVSAPAAHTVARAPAAPANPVPVAAHRGGARQQRVWADIAPPGPAAVLPVQQPTQPLRTTADSVGTASVTLADFRPQVGPLIRPAPQASRTQVPETVNSPVAADPDRIAPVVEVSVPVPVPVPIDEPATDVQTPVAPVVSWFSHTDETEPAGPAPQEEVAAPAETEPVVDSVPVPSTVLVQETPAPGPVRHAVSSEQPAERETIQQQSFEQPLRDESSGDERIAWPAPRRSMLDAVADEPRVEPLVSGQPLQLVDPHALPVLVAPDSAVQAVIDESVKPESSARVATDREPTDQTLIPPALIWQAGTVEPSGVERRTVANDRQPRVERPVSPSIRRKSESSTQEPVQPPRKPVNVRPIRRASFAAQMGGLNTQVPVTKPEKKVRRKDSARFGPTE